MSNYSNGTNTKASYCPEASAQPDDLPRTDMALRGTSTPSIRPVYDPASSRMEDNGTSRNHTDNAQTSAVEVQFMTAKELLLNSRESIASEEAPVSDNGNNGIVDEIACEKSVPAVTVIKDSLEESPNGTLSDICTAFRNEFFPGPATLIYTGPATAPASPAPVSATAVPVSVSPVPVPVSPAPISAAAPVSTVPIAPAVPALKDSLEDASTEVLPDSDMHVEKRESNPIPLITVVKDSLDTYSYSDSSMDMDVESLSGTMSDQSSSSEMNIESEFIPGSTPESVTDSDATVDTDEDSFTICDSDKTPTHLPDGHDSDEMSDVELLHPFYRATPCPKIDPPTTTMNVLEDDPIFSSDTDSMVIEDPIVTSTQTTTSHPAQPSDKDEEDEDTLMSIINSVSFNSPSSSGTAPENKSTEIVNPRQPDTVKQVMDRKIVEEKHPSPTTVLREGLPQNPTRTNPSSNPKQVPTPSSPLANDEEDIDYSSFTLEEKTALLKIAEEEEEKSKLEIKLDQTEVADLHLSDEMVESLWDASNATDKVSENAEHGLEYVTSVPLSAIPGKQPAETQNPEYLGYNWFLYLYHDSHLTVDEVKRSIEDIGATTGEEMPPIREYSSISSECIRISFTPGIPTNDFNQHCYRIASDKKVICAASFKNEEDDVNFYFFRDDKLKVITVSNPLKTEEEIPRWMKIKCDYEHYSRDRSSCRTNSVSDPFILSKYPPLLEVLNPDSRWISLGSDLKRTWDTLAHPWILIAYLPPCDDISRMKDLINEYGEENWSPNYYNIRLSKRCLLVVPDNGASPDVAKETFHRMGIKGFALLREGKFCFRKYSERDKSYDEIEAECNECIIQNIKTLFYAAIFSRDPTEALIAGSTNPSTIPNYFNGPSKKENKSSAYIHLSFGRKISCSQVYRVVHDCYFYEVRGFSTKEDIAKEVNATGRKFVRVNQLKTSRHPFAFRVDVPRRDMEDLCEAISVAIFNRERPNRPVIKIVKPRRDTQNTNRPGYEFRDLFNVSTLNIGSAVNRKGTILSLMDMDNIQFLALQETHSVRDEEMYTSPGITFAENGPETIGSGVHGVMTVTPYEMATRIAYDSTPNLVIQRVDFEGKRSLYFASVYIPCKDVDSRRECINKITDVIVALKSNDPDTPIIIGGDFNTHPDDFEATFPALTRLFVRVTPEEPTFSNKNGSTIIDYVLYSHPEFLKVMQKEVISTGFTSHSLLKVKFKDTRPAYYRKRSDPHPNTVRVKKEFINLMNNQAFELNMFMKDNIFDKSSFNNYIESCIGRFEEVLEKWLRDTGCITETRRTRKPHMSGLDKVHERARELEKIPKETRTPEQQEEYKRSKEILKKSDDICMWEIINEICENARNNDVSQVYAKVRDLIGGDTIHNKLQVKASEESEIVYGEAGKEVFRKHLEKSCAINPEFIVPYEIEVSKTFSDQGIGYPIEMEELSAAIMKAGKVAAGIDAVSNQLLVEMVKRQDSCIFMNTVLTICNFILKGYITERLNTSVISFIPKKNNALLVDEFRPIAVGTTFAKLTAAVIADRLTKKCVKENIITPEQNAFLPNRDCLGQALSLLNIIEKMKKGNPETNPGYVAFLDIRGAYNSVNHELLLKILEKMKLDEDAVNFIKAMYATSSVAVKWGSTDDHLIPVRRGLKQGDPLSPILFLLYINEITTSKSGSSKMLLYADDIVVYDTDIESLNTRLEEIGSFLLERDLEINPRKCGVMGVNMNSQKRLTESCIKCQGMTIEAVSEYKYLGIPMSIGFERKDMVKKLLARAEKLLNMMTPFIRNYHLPVGIRANFMKSTFLSVLYYGLEVVYPVNGAIQEYQKLQSKALQLLNGSDATASHIVLHREFEVLPIDVVVMRKLIRIFTSPTMTALSLLKLAEQVKKTNFKSVPEDFPEAEHANPFFSRWMTAAITTVFCYNIQKKHFNRANELTRAWFNKTFKTGDELVRFALDYFERVKPYSFLGCQDKAFYLVVRNNMRMFFTPSSILEKIGIPRYFIKKYGHNFKATEVIPTRYLENQMCSQRDYLEAWIHGPHLAKGFNVILWMRVGIFLTQERLRHIPSDIREELCKQCCIFCKEGKPENSFHLLNECKKWDELRKECLEEIRKLVPTLDPDFKISQFVLGDPVKVVYGRWMYDKKNKGDNKEMFQWSDNYALNIWDQSWRIKKLEGRDEEGNELDNREVRIKIWVVIAKFLMEVETRRRAILRGRIGEVSEGRKFRDALKRLRLRTTRKDHRSTIPDRTKNMEETEIQQTTCNTEETIDVGNPSKRRRKNGPMTNTDIPIVPIDQPVIQPEHSTYNERNIEECTQGSNYVVNYPNNNETARIEDPVISDVDASTNFMDEENEEDERTEENEENERIEETSRIEEDNMRRINDNQEPPANSYQPINNPIWHGPDPYWWLRRLGNQWGLDGRESVLPNSEEYLQIVISLLAQLENAKNGGNVNNQPNQPLESETPSIHDENEERLNIQQTNQVRLRNLNNRTNQQPRTQNQQRSDQHYSGNRDTTQDMENQELPGRTRKRVWDSYYGFDNEITTKTTRTLPSTRRGTDPGFSEGVLCFGIPFVPHSEQERTKYRNAKKHYIYPLSETPIVLRWSEREEAFILRNYGRWCMLFVSFKSGWFDTSMTNAWNPGKAMEFPYENPELTSFGSLPSKSEYMSGTPDMKKWRTLQWVVATIGSSSLEDTALKSECKKYVTRMGFRNTNTWDKYSFITKMYCLVYYNSE